MVVKTYAFVGKSANCDLTLNWTPVRGRIAAVNNSVLYGRSALTPLQTFSLVWYVRNMPRIKSFCPD